MLPVKGELRLEYDQRGPGRGGPATCEGEDSGSAARGSDAKAGPQRSNCTVRSNGARSNGGIPSVRAALGSGLAELENVSTLESTPDSSHGGSVRGSTTPIVLARTRILHPGFGSTGVSSTGVASDEAQVFRTRVGGSSRRGGRFQGAPQGST